MADDWQSQKYEQESHIFNLNEPSAKIMADYPNICDLNNNTSQRNPQHLQLEGSSGPYTKNETLKIVIYLDKNHNKRRKNYKVFRYTKQYILSLLNSFNMSLESNVSRHFSVPNIKPGKVTDLNNVKNVKSTDVLKRKPNYYNTDFIVNNCCHTCDKPECLNPFMNPFIRVRAKIYRCQINAKEEESCCCACNSDAMFEVMKSLYDCYKKKNCDNCKCILCGHLPREERRLGEMRKSAAAMADAGVETVAAKGLRKDQLALAKAAGLLTPLTGKTPEQKENIVRGLIKQGLPPPEGKTPSEKKLIEKIRNEVGLPPEPKTSAEKKSYKKADAAGIITPLEGKTPAQKEKILRNLRDFGVPLPEGRTQSEKALIAKIKAEPIGQSTLATPSAKLRKAKEAGYLSPLGEKTPKQKENTLKGLAYLGLPFPDAKTPSDQKLMDKVRGDLGLPPEPKTAAGKEKYKKALADGIITPLEGKSPPQKEKVLKRLAEEGIPLPEGRTKSEKALISKVKAATPARPIFEIPSEKLRKAKAAGLLTPLEGKKPEQKEKILKGLATLGLPLPEGKTPSDRRLIDKVRNQMGLPPEPKTAADKERYQKALAAGIITPLEGKTPAQKEKILKKLAEEGIPLPEGRTKSEKALIAKVKAIIPTKKLTAKARMLAGLPPEPKTTAEKEKYKKAEAEGIITPLDDKTPSQKENIIKKMLKAGIPLPEGRTVSEKALIAKAKAEAPLRLPSGIHVPSEKLRKAKAAGFVTPLEGKKPEQKEKILRGLAAHGIPLPEGRSSSEKKLIDKIRKQMGLPPEPKTPTEKEKYKKALTEGIITPLEGKTPAQKENALKKMAQAGIPLPEGRTPSEKALINKVKAEKPIGFPSAKLRKAKAGGFLTPLTGKTPKEKEKIVKGLAGLGLPLPDAKTASEQKLFDKVRAELGLPPEPKTAIGKEKYRKALADGIITPLQGKTPAQKEKALKKMAEAGIPLPEGRTPSEKALIAKVKAAPVGAAGAEIPPPSEGKPPLARAAEAAMSLTPLKGKTPQQKEKILRGLVAQRKPLPEARTPSEQKLIDKVRADVGLPPEPKTAAGKEKYKKALAKGIITPLEGKTPAQKEKVLKKLAEEGIPLPEGRTKSEKALIAKVKASTLARPILGIPSEKLRKAKAAGLLTPLEEKKLEQKEKILKGLAAHGLPLPEGKTPSDRRLIDKVRNQMGLPPEPKTAADKEKYQKAMAAGIITPLEGKTPAQKEKILKKLAEEGIPLPEGRTKSEKALIAKIKATTPTVICDCAPFVIPSEKLRKAKAAGFLTPLEGKKPEQKEKILKGLAALGIPLPEAKSPSEKKLIDKIRNQMGLPPEPKTAAERDKYLKAMAAGIITPLEGKNPAQKEQILKRLADEGIPLPDGRTKSEKALIEKIKAAAPTKPPFEIPSEKLRKAKEAGLLTPLEGKTHKEKEKIIQGLAKLGIPLLPEGKTESEKKLIAKARQQMGLPPEPLTPAEKEKYQKALIDGIITPLEGKNPAQKEKILRRLADEGIPLPDGRTKSEKALTEKIKAATPAKPPFKIPSEKLRKAKEAGLLTPLEGKTPKEKEKIIQGLAKLGMPLPEGKTPSEKKLIAKARQQMGLPPEPQTPAEKERYQKALTDGIITPLEGKTAAQKKKALEKMMQAGIALPEGRSPSEKALIAKLKPETPKFKIPSRKIRKAKEAGFLTPLEGKSPAQKEKILRGLAMNGIPLPEAKTPAEKKLMDKVRADLGLPPEPKTAADKEKYNRAIAAGIITPLEGKTPAQKEKALTKMKEAGMPLPKGRTASEKALIAKVKAAPTMTPSEKIGQAKAAGLLTPLEGKTPEEREKILKGLLEMGLPLPEPKTESQKALIRKVRAEAGLTPSPTPSEKKRLNLAELMAGKKGGVTEKVQEMVRKSTCDRACGCDKKKIKFKHSYVKIRVTSLDMSSLCACPPDCIPEFKRGIVCDNEGIKVTVGNVLGVPSFTPSSARKSMQSASFDSYANCSSSSSTSNDYKDMKGRQKSDFRNNYRDSSIHDEFKYVLQTDTCESCVSFNKIDNISCNKLQRIYSKRKASSYTVFNTYELENSGKDLDISGTKAVVKSKISLFLLSRIDLSSTNVTRSIATESIMLLRTESSLSFSSDSSSSGLYSVSVYSFADSSYLSSSSPYTDMDIENEFEYTTDTFDYNGIQMEKSDTFPNNNNFCVTENLKYLTKLTKRYRKNDDNIEIKNNEAKKKKEKKKDKKKEKPEEQETEKIPLENEEPANQNKSPIVVINDIQDMSIEKVITNILKQSPLSDSSVFVVVPTDEHDTDATNNSTLILQVSQDNFRSNSSDKYNEKPNQLAPNPYGIKFKKSGKNQMNKVEKSALKKKHVFEETKAEKRCRIVEPASEDDPKKLEVHYTRQKAGTVATDTSTDRPCGCEQTTETTENFCNDEFSSQISSKTNLIQTRIDQAQSNRSQQSVEDKYNIKTASVSCEYTDKTQTPCCCCKSIIGDKGVTEITETPSYFQSYDRIVATARSSPMLTSDTTLVGSIPVSEQYCAPIQGHEVFEPVTSKNNRHSILQHSHHGRTDQKTSTTMPRGVKFAPIQDYQGFDAAQCKNNGLSILQHYRRVRSDQQTSTTMLGDADHPLGTRRVPVTSSANQLCLPAQQLHVCCGDSETLDNQQRICDHPRKQPSPPPALPGCLQVPCPFQHPPSSCPGAPCPDAPGPSPQNNKRLKKGTIIIVVDDQRETCPCQAQDTTTDNQPCTCPNDSKKRSPCCQCPPCPTAFDEGQGGKHIEAAAEGESLEDSEYDLLRRRYMMQMKSELTQTTSGFKVKVQKRDLGYTPLTFEEALMFYGNTEEYQYSEDLRQGTVTEHDDCICEGRETIENSTTIGEPRPKPKSKSKSKVKSKDKSSRTNKPKVICECPSDTTLGLEGYGEEYRGEYGGNIGTKGGNRGIKAGYRRTKWRIRGGTKEENEGSTEGYDGSKEGNEGHKGKTRRSFRGFRGFRGRSAGASGGGASEASGEGSGTSVGAEGGTTGGALEGATGASGAANDVAENKEHPFGGLKLNVEGKGSKSPGLAGICCFDRYGKFKCCG